MTEETVRAALRQVIDPEIGVDIVSLGLVREVRVAGGRVRVRMILTAPGCPLEGVMRRGAEAVIGRMPGVEAVEVEIAREPIWTPALMEPTALEET